MAGDIGRESGIPSWSRAVDVSRATGSASLAERREAAQRRLSSSARAAELVACGLRAFDEAMTERALPDAGGVLRATVRASLALAYETPGYDLTLVTASGDVAVRVRHTTFGPEAEVIDLTEQTAAGDRGGGWVQDLPTDDPLARVLPPTPREESPTGLVDLTGPWERRTDASPIAGWWTGNDV